MTQRGIIQRGAIVLEKPIDLPEGSSVEVEIVPVSATRQPASGSLEDASQGIAYEPEALVDLRKASEL